MTQSERLLWLIEYLKAESPDYAGLVIPQESSEQFRLYRSLVNVRLPQPVSDDYLAVEDAFLQEENARKGITPLGALSPVEDNIYLWQGDITTLACDAIVNAANSQMLGCFYPCHACIDNCIHTFAGVRLRLQCATVMKTQGTPEPTGSAKLTPAYNLPAKYVLHTVGPIVSGTLTQRDCDLLASCYRSCLSLAAENGLQSVAFCCISTGEFRFPNEAAAKIAVETVRSFEREADAPLQVIFNVFKDKDKRLYEQLLG
ncbi:MAG: protein-ADP-ribose hydrolase [Eubacterium sp.]|nr:protein-ADP-ribose hydrolase [Eubacterium sp.]